MLLLEENQRNKVAHLFSYPTSSMILSSLQGYVGEIWADDMDEPSIALICVGRNFYIAGEIKNSELILDQIKECIDKSEPNRFEIIPQSEEWCEILETLVDGPNVFTLEKTFRHLMKAELMKFDTYQLHEYASAIPNDLILVDINEELFLQAKSLTYTKHFVPFFDTFKEFSKFGAGCFLCKEGEIVGGATSYTRYDEGIEVQIAVAPEFRGNGLATACGAKLVLECIWKGLYPWWDCANPISERIATKLGYSLDRITKVYRYIKK